MNSIVKEFQKQAPTAVNNNNECSIEVCVTIRKCMKARVSRALAIEADQYRNAALTGETEMPEEILRSLERELKKKQAITADEDVVDAVVWCLF